MKLLLALLPRRGRESRPAPGWWIVLKTLWHMATFTTLFFGVLPLALAEIEKRTPLARWRFGRPGLRAVGGAVFVLFAALGVWSCAVMAWRGRGTMLPIDCAPRLVQSGPYKWVRNPMVIAGLGQGLGVALAHGSPLVLAYVMAAALARQWILGPWEEADLEARFGSEWAEYRERVPEWWPQCDRAGTNKPSSG